MSLKIVFMGTPDFSVPVLAGLLDAGHSICGVYTQPPRPAKRGKREHKSAVHEFAESKSLEVRTPDSLKAEDEQAKLASLGADVAVVVAYGQILPKAILDTPRHGCLNLHASLLPRWRGAAPIQRAVMAGDEKTGVCVMRMDEGLDTGDVCLRHQIKIPPGMTAGELHDVLASHGADAMVRALALLESGDLDCMPQASDGVSYAAKITKQEAAINFDQPASELINIIHGLSPFPGAWFQAQQGDQTFRIKVLKAETVEGSGTPGEVLDVDLTIACASGAIRPLVLQREGKGALDRETFLRGFAIAPGTIITST